MNECSVHSFLLINLRAFRNTNTYVIAQFFRQIKRFTLENSCMTNLVIHEKEEKKRFLRKLRNRLDNEIVR